MGYWAGFHTGFFVGEGIEKKITQGYSCQHLIIHIVIEGSDLKEVNFNQVQRSEPLHSIIIIIIVTISGGGGNHGYETLLGIWKLNTLQYSSFENFPLYCISLLIIFSFT